MIRLRDLRFDGSTWEAAADFSLPAVDRYNLATDCLDHPADAPAIIDGDVVVTFGELAARSAALAHHLAALGVAPGDRVAVKLSQSIDMAVAILGVIRSRAIVVPLSNVVARGGLEHRLADSSPSAVIAADGDDVFTLARDARHLATSELAGLEPVPSDLPETSADEPALLLYTSGTTGKPKGVLHAHRVVLGHHAIDLAFDRVRTTDVAHSPVDWTWAGGLLLGLLVPLAHGIPVVAHRDPHFDPVACVDLMRRTGVSVGLFPPTVLRLMRASGAMTVESVATTRLRCLITGAEAVEPELIEWGDHLGITINNAYGQTEANALVGHATLDPPLDQATMGRPYPGRRIAILDDDLRPVADEVAGQLAVAADDLVCMLEYWNDPEATAAKRRGGWLLTGDTVHRQADGALRFHGRNDDIIKSGAYRLGPAEIEAAILRHVEVAECAAIGVPDEIRGEVVAAVVRLRGGVEIDRVELTAQLQRLVRADVGAHAYPRVVHVVDEMPRTTTNKIDRAAVRRSLLEGAR